jgi:hypothetical protein
MNNWLLKKGCLREQLNPLINKEIEFAIATTLFNLVYFLEIFI